jgi:hypothetical protein
MRHLVFCLTILLHGASCSPARFNFNPDAWTLEEIERHGEQDTVLSNGDRRLEYFRVDGESVFYEGDVRILGEKDRSEKNLYETMLAVLYQKSWTDVVEDEDGFLTIRNWRNRPVCFKKDSHPQYQHGVINLDNEFEWEPLPEHHFRPRHHGFEDPPMQPESDATTTRTFRHRRRSVKSGQYI